MVKVVNFTVYMFYQKFQKAKFPWPDSLPLSPSGHSLPGIHPWSWDEEVRAERTRARQ